MEQYINDILIFEQTVGKNLHGGAVEQALALTDSARTNVLTVSVSQTLFLGQTPVSRSSIFSVSAVNRIEFSDRGAPTTYVSCVDLLPLYDSARPIYQEIVIETLNLSQSIFTTVGTHAENELTFGQTVSGVWIRSITIPQTFVIISSATGHTGDEFDILITVATLSGPNAPEC